ncbi:carbohydrate ABC transporter permease [Paenibacillus mucilaginosus]|uniref:Binding-protein-dependent transport systems inner membrane component n=3 Tax=Paenibacillus mucilaginosus TaxID=61624 RepID=H6NI44_9BACL|nr:carbohydrate ABC transporter permease [Paenibacillus mucilaginosus]AEI43148.1 binding-protein-dependent transport systems inner membrane component [Paenibacillus mucilaginosus KNP414]AFC30815.1 binding-protein-dependent transport systems inner membrane component [Paenibacillus mucilaginosus 3016]AFH63137.2 sugar ABC transporter permease [Paenibacillus mucilaginosus K02]MCG7212285.1 carbohydrate ABC transporter permease [Paenibacillus mucilaginosus]WDM24754.1 carbohydrate ABC transporter per
MTHRSIGDKLFDTCNYILLSGLMIVTLYPFLYVLFASLSTPSELVKHTGILWKPAGFYLEGYKLVLKNPMIAVGYKNTLFYVTAGTVLNVFFTALFAFVLSRRDLYWKKYMMMMIVFTMFFSGGLIPEYMLIKNLGLLDTRWSLIVPGLIATWNLIIMRTSFQSIPYELEEAAKMDGASDWTVFAKVILPLSVPLLAVMVLFYGVAHWNAWASALIYLRDRDLFPLQLVLREILIQNSTTETTNLSTASDPFLGEVVKYATIIVATVPILIVYPLIQRHFTKGVMIGALKG